MKYFLLGIMLVLSLLALTQQNNFELSLESATELAHLPLECISQEYPNKLNQVLTDSTYLASPSELHPVFYGCFDWHSSVHGHWLLARLMRRYPDTDLEDSITLIFDRQFTREKVAAELAYFEPSLEKSFERTYGWAWLLKLHTELLDLELNEEHGWTEKLQPLTDFIAESYKKFLPKLVYPIRVGEHTNTAFGLSLAWDYAMRVRDNDLALLIEETVNRFYLNDQNCPVSWEPGGFDFLSPCLQEAELMSKILPKDDFAAWMKKFMPEIFRKDFDLEPGKVLDRTDGKLVHLDGLNFSRAWCLYSIGNALPSQKEKLRKIADKHLAASMPFVAESHYMGSHWLATFLLYALQCRAL